MKISVDSDQMASSEHGLVKPTDLDIFFIHCFQERINLDSDG